MVKKKKLKQALEEATRYREELYKKTGNTRPGVDTIREDRDHGH
jgi:hypothetical protein